MCTILLITVPGSALASSKSPCDSGYDHGCDDAGIPNPGDRYINQPEKGPAFHTSEFMNGYNSGFNSCSSYDSNQGSNYYTPQQDEPRYETYSSESNSRKQANCDEAGLAGGLIGGGLAGMVGGPQAAPGGYAAGSSILKDMCENNNR